MAALAFVIGTALAALAAAYVLGRFALPQSARRAFEEAPRLTVALAGQWSSQERFALRRCIRRALRQLPVDARPRSAAVLAGASGGGMAHRVELTGQHGGTAVLALSPRMGNRGDEFDTLLSCAAAQIPLTEACAHDATLLGAWLRAVTGQNAADRTVETPPNVASPPRTVLHDYLDAWAVASAAARTGDARRIRAAWRGMSAVRHPQPYDPAAYHPANRAAHEVGLGLALARIDPDTGEIARALSIAETLLQRRTSEPVAGALSSALDLARFELMLIDTEISDDWSSATRLDREMSRVRQVSSAEGNHALAARLGLFAARARQIAQGRSGGEPLALPAVEAARDAIRAAETAGDASLQVDARLVLGRTLIDAAERLGLPRLLDDAISEFERAHAAASDRNDLPRIAAARTGHGIALSILGAQRRDAAQLSAAIRLLETSSDVEPRTENVERLARAGRARIARHSIVPSDADLSAAIDALSSATRELAPLARTFRLRRLDTAIRKALAGARIELAERTRDSELAHSGVATAKSVLGEAMPTPDALERADLEWLVARGMRTGLAVLPQPARLSRLREAAAALERGLAALAEPEVHAPETRRRLNHMLGETLCEAGTSGLDRDALDRAASALNAALADAEGLPRADSLMMLGRTLHQLDTFDGQPKRRAAAIMACTEARDLYHAAGDPAGRERAHALHETLKT